MSDNKIKAPIEATYKSTNLLEALSTHFISFISIAKVPTEELNT